MFMRYLGGGVGHCSPASVTVYDDDDDDEPMDVDQPFSAHRGDNADATREVLVEDNGKWECDEDEDEDDGDEDDSDLLDSDESDDEDDDLGPEDGEDEGDDEADLDEYDDL